MNSDINKSLKKTVFVDMDNVLVDFQSGIDRLDKSVIKEYGEDIDHAPGIFSLMDPMEDAIESYKILTEEFDTYILSTAPWHNPSAWSDKLLWVKKHLGDLAYKRIILTHHKNLVRGDYLIDDRTKNGAGEFQGEHIHFGESDYPDWKSVMAYLCANQQSLTGTK